MVHGRTPFQDLGTMAAKVHAITDASYKIPFPKLKNAALQETLKCCLNRDPRARVSMQVDSLLNTTAPNLSRDGKIT